MKQKEFYSVKEVADLLGLSRQIVSKKIKEGIIKGEKIGRNYIIKRSELSDVLSEELTSENKKILIKGVKKAVEQYGETLEKLGKE